MRSNGIARSLVLLLCLALASGVTAQEQTSADLSGAWKMSLSDIPEHSTVAQDDSAWKEVQLPGNLARKGAVPGRWLWLRKHFQLASQPEANVALTVGAVFDSDEIYINGVRIGGLVSEGVRPTNYGRPRLYTVPPGLLTAGDNLVALRLKGAFKNEIGFMGSPVQIQSLPQAISALYAAEVKGLIYAATYVVIGIFFILLYFRIKELREYLWFGIFAIVFGTMQVARNEYRFELGDWFLTFKLIEQIAYTALPTLYLLFFRNLFRLSLPRLVYLYPLVNTMTAVSLIVFFNPLWWDRIIGIWFFINIPFFAYYGYIAAMRAARKGEGEAIIVGSGTVLMIGATIHFFLVERGLIDGPSYFSFMSLLFMLSIAMALIFRMIKLQQEVEDRQQRLNEVNELRDRVFSYINTFVRKPAEEISRLCTELFSDEQGEMSRMAVAAETNQEVENLQVDLDDILELSRLEVIQEPEYVETVNFNDFITAVIPEGDITCYIKVNPDIVLKTSLELVNSIVIRLIDFPGFRQFRHIDLIITSDLKQNIHFRFLLYHTTFRETRKLYELLTSENPERGSLWVKWGIIRQITRILDGDLEISIVNRKFLRIDIRLSAELPADVARASRRSGTLEVKHRAADVLEAVVEGNSDEEVAVAAAAVSGSLHPPASPVFSKDMSISEFIAAIKAKVRGG